MKALAVIVLMNTVLVVSHVHGQQRDVHSLLTLLPEDTVAAVLVNDFPKALQLHRAEGKQQATTEASPIGLNTCFGIDLDLLTGAATGMLVRARIISENKMAADVVIAHSTKEAAERLLISAQETLLHDGTTRRIESLGSTDARIYERRGAGSKRTVVHVWHNDVLVLSDDLSVVRQIVQRLSAGHQDKPAPRGLNDIQAKLSFQPQQHQVGLFWYSNPWEWQNARSSHSADKSTRVASARRHALTDIQAIGGMTLFGEADIQSTETIVHAPPPLHSTFQMMGNLQSADDLQLASWIPRDVDDVELLHMDVPGALQHVATLFEDVYADGIDGTYEEILGDLKNELHVDLAKDLYPLLGPRVHIVRMRSGKPSHQGVLLAIETSSPKKVAKMFRLLMQDDNDVKRLSIKGYSDPLWYVPSLEGQGDDFVLMVAHDNAFFSNDLKLMRRILSVDAGNSLRNDPDLVEIYKSILQHHSRGPCLIIARGREDTAAKPSTDLARSDKNTPATPLDFVFLGPDALNTVWDQDAGRLLRNAVPLLGDHRLVVVFPEDQGWRLHSLQAPSK